MNARKTIGHAAVSALSALALLAVAGCGDDSGLAKRYPVSGKVTYKGESVKHGTIRFEPVNNIEGRAASGTIEDGYYSLTTAVQDDGALPGEYNVTILAQETDTSQINAKAKGGAGRQDDVIKATKRAKRLVPSKYELAQTSGLKKQVKPESNKFDIELTD